MTLLVDRIVFSLQRHGGISIYFCELLESMERDAVPALLTLAGTLPQDTRLLAGRSLRILECPAGCSNDIGAAACMSPMPPKCSTRLTIGNHNLASESDCPRCSRK